MSTFALWQVSLWSFSRSQGFPCPMVSCCPSAAPSSSQRSEHGACWHLMSCVQANLSFFFHYPGMYCHLIFMYAILPDKYDLLPGNSSDVHSVPCSNYGSVPRRRRVLPSPCYTCQPGRDCLMPFHASLLLANTSKGRNEMNIFA